MNLERILQKKKNKGKYFSQVQNVLIFKLRVIKNQKDKELRGI